MLLSSNQSTRVLQRRMKQFRVFIGDPATANTEFTKMYKGRILDALACQAGPGMYVPGDAIYGDHEA